LPFSKYAVDPEQIEVMRAAFHRVCDVLQLNCGTDDRMTELVVMKIVQLARGGEMDPEQLCISVLAELESSPLGFGRHVTMGQRLDEFRAAAAECLEAAKATEDVKAAAVLLSMARKWLELADKEPPMEDRFPTQLPEFNRRQLRDD
jgi:hypothetical protein